MPNDDDLQRYSSEPLDPRRVNRAIYTLEDAWWLIGPIASAKRYKWWTISVAGVAMIFVRPDLTQAILEVLK